MRRHQLERFSIRTPSIMDLTDQHRVRPIPPYGLSINMCFVSGQHEGVRTRTILPAIALARKLVLGKRVSNSIHIGRMDMQDLFSDCTIVV